MAWNPPPEIALARDFGKRFNKKQVIILFVGEDDRPGYASYGRTKSLCDRAGALADKTLETLASALDQAGGK